jgi:hypothetical protein
MSFLLTASSALAAEPYDHKVSLTLSPIHLLLPMLEVTGEGRLADKVGVAGIVGFGSVGDLALFEAGAQGRYYVLGTFDHGMEVGGELLYVGASGEMDGVQASGSGLSAGPFLGYKFAARFGLTVDVQAGAAYTFVTAEASGGGEAASAEDSALSPLVNLQLGWSF